MKKIILLFAMMLAVGTMSAADKLYATFGSLPGGAPATLNKYTWSATNNNLLPVFEFSNGELANYTTLEFKLSNLTGGMVRMGYYVGSTFTEFGSGFGSSGDKTVDLTALNIDLSTVTKIAFGGRTLNDNSTPGSVNISNVCLVPASGDNLNMSAVLSSWMTVRYGWLRTEGWPRWMSTEGLSVITVATDWRSGHIFVA